jgi:hypothetical protein
MGMSAQGSQGGVQSNGSQVFYDSETGHTIPSQYSKKEQIL